jgi:hypothetical protein
MGGKETNLSCVPVGQAWGAVNETASQWGAGGHDGTRREGKN